MDAGDVPYVRFDKNGEPIGVLCTLATELLVRLRKEPNMSTSASKRLLECVTTLASNDLPSSDEVARRAALHKQLRRELYGRDTLVGKLGKVHTKMLEPYRNVAEVRIMADYLAKSVWKA